MAKEKQLNKFYPVDINMDFGIKGKKKARIRFSVELEGLTKKEQEKTIVNLKPAK